MPAPNFDNRFLTQLGIIPISLIIGAVILITAAAASIPISYIINQTSQDIRSSASGESCDWCAGADQCYASTGRAPLTGSLEICGGLPCCMGYTPPSGDGGGGSGGGGGDTCNVGDRKPCGTDGCANHQQKICQAGSPNYWGPCVNSTTCGYIGGGAGTTCSLDTHCNQTQGLKCINNKCQLTQTTTPKEINQGCSTNKECASGYCNPIAGTCQTKPKNAGENCTKNSECDLFAGFSCITGKCQRPTPTSPTPKPPNTQLDCGHEGTRVLSKGSCCNPAAAVPEKLGDGQEYTCHDYACPTGGEYAQIEPGQTCHCDGGCYCINPNNDDEIYGTAPKNENCGTPPSTPAPKRPSSPAISDRSTARCTPNGQHRWTGDQCCSGQSHFDLSGKEFCGPPPGTTSTPSPTVVSAVQQLARTIVTTIRSLITSRTGTTPTPIPTPILTSIEITPQAMHDYCQTNNMIRNSFTTIPTCTDGSGNYPINLNSICHKLTNNPSSSAVPFENRYFCSN